jgi:hypothetical protein
MPSAAAVKNQSTAKAHATTSWRGLELVADVTTFHATPDGHRREAARKSWSGHRRWEVMARLRRS